LRAKATGWASIKFVGFRNQREMPSYYSVCDVFVLPSAHESWGLVVNEVMNAGKPVIVSDQVGAAVDLIRDGKNGYIVPVGDSRTLREAIRHLTEEPALAQLMGEESRRVIDRFSFAEDIVALLAALQKIVTHGDAATAKEAA